MELTCLFTVGFIRGDMEHLRGTECDSRVRSSGESSGMITSPNYPNSSPPNITCYYYIDGLIDTENLEKVILDFSTIQLPSNDSPRYYAGAYINADFFIFGPPVRYIIK